MKIPVGSYFCMVWPPGSQAIAHLRRSHSLPDRLPLPKHMGRMLFCSFVICRMPGIEMLIQAYVTVLAYRTGR